MMENIFNGIGLFGLVQLFCTACAVDAGFFGLGGLLLRLLFGVACLAVCLGGIAFCLHQPHKTKVETVRTYVYKLHDTLA